MQVLKIVLQLGALTFSDCLHGSIETVPHPASHPDLPGAAGCKGTVAYTLNTAVDNRVQPLLCLCTHDLLLINYFFEN